MAKKKKEIDIQRTTREVEIPLNETEINERRELAAELMEQIDTLESDFGKKQELFKKEKSEFEETRDLKETSRNDALREIRKKKAKKLVELDEVMDYEEKKVFYYYPNASKGTVVDSREFTEEESQLRFFKDKAESIPSDGMAAEIF